MFRAINAPFLSNLTFLSRALFSFLLFVVNILRTAFFPFLCLFPSYLMHSLLCLNIAMESNTLLVFFSV